MIDLLTWYEKDIIDIIFHSNEQSLDNTIYPQYLIEDTLRKFFTKHIETDGNLDWIFGGNKAEIIYKYVSESFIREFWDYITNWQHFWCYFKASESFIKECPVKNWYEISKYQKLSEQFIHEYQDRVDWDQICEYQKLSFPFIKKHHKEVNWDIVLIYQESWFKKVNKLDQ